MAADAADPAVQPGDPAIRLVIAGGASGAARPLPRQPSQLLTLPREAGVLLRWITSPSGGATFARTPEPTSTPTRDPGRAALRLDGVPGAGPDGRDQGVPPGDLTARIRLPVREMHRRVFSGRPTPRPGQGERLGHDRPGSMPWLTSTGRSAASLRSAQEPLRGCPGCPSPGGLPVPVAVHRALDAAATVLVTAATDTAAGLSVAGFGSLDLVPAIPQPRHDAQEPAPRSAGTGRGRLRGCARPICGRTGGPDCRRRHPACSGDGSSAKQDACTHQPSGISNRGHCHLPVPAAGSARLGSGPPRRLRHVSSRCGPAPVRGQLAWPAAALPASPAGPQAPTGHRSRRCLRRWRHT